MSMRDYAVNDYGLLLTKEMVKMVASKVCEDYTDEDYAEDPWGFNEELYDNGIIQYIGNFTGEAIEVNDLGENLWGDSEYYGDDAIYYVPTSKISTLFRAAYRDMDDLIKEFKSKVGEYLPEDFDYRKYVRNISGTYFG